MSEHAFHVLVVDDDESMRDELKTLLEEYGLIVETASNGEEGLAKLLNAEFDVAVVDLKMPKMGGLEMIRQANAKEVDTYVVILTGKGDKNDAIEALKLQQMVKEWVEKPIIDADAFAQRVKEIAAGISHETISRIMSKLPPVPEFK